MQKELNSNAIILGTDEVNNSSNSSPVELKGNITVAPMNLVCFTVIPNKV